MQLAGRHPDGSEIISGSLSCQSCGLTVPVVNGVPRFDSHGYAHNFSAQWKRFTDFAKYYAVDDETYYRKGLGLVPADVSGKKVLEVGCGNGRAVRHFLKGRPELFVALDLSEAIDVVQQEFRSAANLLPIECDLRRMALKPRSFDIVFTYGVLHHTPDAAAAFQSVAKFVAPGGTLAIWVYNPKNRPGTISDWVQRNSHRIPRALLLVFCWFSALLGYGFYLWSKIPGLRLLHRPALKTAQQGFRILESKHFMQHLLWAHDFHTTRYTSYHTPDEVKGWFKAAGFEDMVNLRGSGMSGRRARIPAVDAETAAAIGEWPSAQV